MISGWEINEEFETFLEDMDIWDDTMSGHYFRWCDYKDVCSNADMFAAKTQLFGKIKNWLHENRPGKYVLTIEDDGVYVLPVNQAERWELTEEEIQEKLIK